jgi:hypothetical protein
MAARENQGYLIAVILLVLLTVVLAIATYFGFTNQNEFANQRDSARAELAKANQARDAYEAQAALMKAYIGMPNYSIAGAATSMSQLEASGDTELVNQAKQITDQYNQDMALHTNKPDSVDATYRGLLSDLVTAINDLHNTKAVLDNQIKDAQDKLRTELAAKDKELEEKDRQLAASRDDLVKERESHDRTRTELQDSLNIAESSVKDLSTKLSSATATIEQNQKTFNGELDKRTNRIADLMSELEDLRKKETDVPDGQIVGVAPILGKVTINLGSADNLLPNQTFAVFDHQKTHFTDGEEKARIEVTRIIDSHLAEGRITDQSNSNPILIRDFVVTSTWDPGYAVPIAIVGVIDMDGDSQSDLARLISIVEQNGGKVVAYHDEEGNVVGKIDENTRLFVVGDKPLGKMNDGFNVLKKQRDTYQVREISVRELLNSMGYRSEAKIQRFNERAFVPRAPTVVSEDDAFKSDK